MKPVLALLLLAGLAGAKPNVLLIGIDDLNDWIGCLDGHPQVETPHLDRLAERGTLFTNAHCQSPLCNPSRTSMMISRRPDTTGIYGLAPWFRSLPELESVVSLPQAFKAAGYTTACSGKIYHGHGFKEEFEHWGERCDFGPSPETKFVETPMNHPLVDWGVYPERDEQQNDWAIADWSIDFLADPERTGPDAPPLFLATGFGRPHLPCFASQEWFDLYPAATTKLPPVRRDDRDDTPMFSWFLHWKLPEVRLSWLEREDEWMPLVRSYLASVSFVDSQVGRLLDALDASPIADDTIIVLFSDHGWHLGEKEISGKNTLWERSTRVPMMIIGPGLPRGQRCDQPVELLDIYPTLLDLAGLPARDELEGLSLRPQLDDPATPRRPAITTHNADNHGVRDVRWRYIRYADGSEELYDLENDPNEWTNLAGEPEHAATKARLAKHLPAESKPLAAGSKHRILEKRGDTWFWEGEPIDPTQLNR